jgi:hypothetical protein
MTVAHALSQCCYKITVMPTNLLRSFPIGTKRIYCKQILFCDKGW